RSQQSDKIAQRQHNQASQSERNPPYQISGQQGTAPWRRGEQTVCQFWAKSNTARPHTLLPGSSRFLKGCGNKTRSLGPLQGLQTCCPWWRGCLTLLGYCLEPFGPLLCTVQDSKDVDGLPPDTVGDDVRLRGNDQLTGPGHSPAPAHLGEGDQPGDAGRD